MSIINKISNALKIMDIYIQPSPRLFKRILILLDKKIMNILFGYNTDEYYLYEFYRLKLSARKTFIGDNKGLKKILQYLNDTKDIIKFDNKILFNKLFAKYIHRDWLSMNECTFDQFYDFCTAHSDYIKKPINQYGGSGIEKHIIPKVTNLSELYNKLKDENCLIEEIIKQDKALASFNPDSVNTIRVYSIISKSKVIITAASLRMGVGNVVVDNFHSGGIGTKIDIDTGIITTLGKNKSAKTFISHPYSNKQIIGFKIPRWVEIKKTIEEAALIVPKVRYVAWDVVINIKGDICLIEGNDKGSFIGQEAMDLLGKKSLYEKLLQDAN